MKLLVSTALLALAVPLAASAQTVPAPITAALADPGRPAADKERDAARHPGELLAFAGIKPGDRVADFIMGGGYFTRILAKTVGDKGHVYAYQPAEFIQFRAAYADEQKTAVAGYANVTPLSDSLATVKFAEPLDAIITVQNWHDLHLKMSPPGFAAAMAKRLYDNLKPGGVLLVVDHVAASDPGFAVPDKLHRIDPAAARAEIESAGFKFEASLPILANPADPHTAIVFDPSIRGKTDQFVFRFRKPR
ncbi:putative methyltransferase [Sphingomonas naasensis]|uniref:Methyltransferase n=1 Tax=Sphingomonas naasensis TaxID=1344951 RepID=A0A4S1W359_9SPHN|nr:class I SAM-dependent methyltransferase [Sphingomonas naasensis]NIJ19643.1 putative methyltransferase [Sphingomonas naasensis]TGX37284.1 methyltransferase [Sphingomonas naasensis]